MNTPAVIRAARRVVKADPLAQAGEFFNAMHALERALAEPRADRALCDNCTWRGPSAECRPARDLHERLDPCGEVPVGECPHCGCLAYIV